MYELLTSRTYHLIFWGLGWQWLTDTWESKIQMREPTLHISPLLTPASWFSIPLSVSHCSKLFFSLPVSLYLFPVSPAKRKACVWFGLGSIDRTCKEEWNLNEPSQSVDSLISDLIFHLGFLFSPINSYLLLNYYYTVNPYQLTFSFSLSFCKSPKFGFPIKLASPFIFLAYNNTWNKLIQKFLNHKAFMLDIKWGYFGFLFSRLYLAKHQKYFYKKMG